MNLELRLETRPGARAGQRVIRAAGRLGMDTVPEFLKAVRAESDPILILDLGGVEWMDSAGVGALIQTQVAMQKEGRKLALARPSERVRAVLALARIEKLFPQFPSVEQAEEGLG